MIKYTNISDKKYKKLSNEKKKEKPYCIKISNGNKQWVVNGDLHREDGPALEYYNGSKYWYLNGKRHREDGPAEESFGKVHWYLNNFYYPFEYWLILTPISDEEKVFLKLKYGKI